MSRERYAKFIEGISLQRIYLADLKCSRELEPVGEKWTVDFSPDFEIVSPDGGNQILVRASFHTNVRNKDDMVFSIDVTFMLVYVSKGDITLDGELKKIFLQNNPPLNSWPYAREIISSLTTRMGFPPLMIEPYKVY